MGILDGILDKFNLFADADSINAERAAAEDSSLSHKERNKFLSAFVNARKEIESIKKTLLSYDQRKLLEIGPLMRGMSIEYEPSAQILQVWPQITQIRSMPSMPKHFGQSLGHLVGLMRFRPLYLVRHFSHEEFILAIIGLRDKGAYYKYVVEPLIPDWKQKVKNYVDFVEGLDENSIKREKEKDPMVTFLSKDFKKLCVQLGI